MGAVNRVIDHAELENTAISGRAGSTARAHGAALVRVQLTDDGLMGQQVFAGRPPGWRMTDEAVEGRDAFLEKREPD